MPLHDSKLSDRTILALFSLSGNSLITPDATIPQVYFDRLRASCTDKPEMGLVLAVLAEALDSYRNALIRQNDYTLSEEARVKATKIIREDERWFRSKRYDWLFSFESICDLFDFDSSSLRKGIAKYKEILFISKRTKITPGIGFRDKHSR
ncbi:MAG: hypothetical protein Q8L47_04410, partial [bacterium]|nr:hypothetical protein [bacterium]